MGGFPTRVLCLPTMASHQQETPMSDDKSKTGADRKLISLQ